MSKSSHTQWESVAVLSPVKLTLDLQGQLQDRTTENALETKITGRITFFDVNITAATLACSSQKYHE